MDLYLNTDMVVRVNGLHQVYSETWVNNAACTASIEDTSGTEIMAAVALNYVGGSDGLYLGVIPNSTPLVEDQEVRLIVTATWGGLKRSWEIPAKCIIAEE